MSAEEFNTIVKNIREELGFPKYEKYEIALLTPEIKPIIEILEERKEWGDAHAVTHALTNIHLAHQKDATWRKRILKGAMLLDEIKPGWENFRFEDMKVQLVYLTEWKSVLNVVYHEDDIRKILPLIFAGQGIEHIAGIRRQPGPPPPLYGKGSDIWEGEITTGHYIAAKEHGFISGAQRSADYLPEENLAMMWIDFILLRKINRLQEGEK